MKKTKLFGGLMLLMLGVGCQSGRNRTSTTSWAPSPAPQPAYTVELIPNPQLTPTSREGDKSNVVYSSNIVAVYANTNGVRAGMTNTPAGAWSAGRP